MILSGLLTGWRRPTAVVPEFFTPKVTATTEAVTRTHVGRVRTINEDRVFASTDRGLWAVADGMGGHFAGDVAAEAIVEALRHLCDDPTPFDDDRIDATLSAAGRQVHRVAAGSTRVSGSTVVALHIDGALGTLFWAGDSRAYRARGGQTEQLSRDHSLVQELVDAGALAPALADRHPQAHVITRALGASAEVAIERRIVSIEAGDLFLLCSDGLTRGGAEPAFALGRPIDAIAEDLLNGALAIGGVDNISLVLVSVGQVTSR